MLSLFYHAFEWIGRLPESTVARPPRRVREELRAVRHLLPMIFGRLDAGVLPAVFAQDAEGVSDASLGGWCLGVSIPAPEELVRVLSESLGRGIPKLCENGLSCASVLEWVQLADERIPVPWTAGSLAWHDLLSRAHSYPEAIHLLEGKALLRSVEILVKLPWT